MSFTGDEFIPDMDLMVWQDDPTTNSANGVPNPPTTTSQKLISSPPSQPPQAPMTMPMQQQPMPPWSGMNIDIGMKDLLVLIIIVLLFANIRLYINYKTLKAAMHMHQHNVAPSS